jgi:hypothetical protein
VSNLDELKEKVKAPSVMAKVKAQQWAKEENDRAARKREEEEAAIKSAASEKLEARAEARETARQSQASGDRAGVKVSLTQPCDL